MSDLTAYEQYKSWSDEEKDKFHKEWEEFVESHHDIELEAKWDTLSVDVDFNDDLTYRSPNNFDIAWKTDKYDLLQLWGYRPGIKRLFDLGFNYVLLSRKHKFVKYLYQYFGAFYQHPVVRTPCSNIVKENQNELCLFILKDDVFGYTGQSWYRDETTMCFTYLGKIKNN